MKSITKLLMLLGLSLSFSGAFAQSYTSAFTSNGGNPGGWSFNEGTAATSQSFTALTPTSGSQTVNSWSASSSIGFPFQFFGQPVTDYKVSLNGLLTFNTSVTGTPPNANGNLPDATLPDRTICVMWDAFSGSPPLGTNDYIAVRTFGTAPNRQHWIWWYSFEYGSPAVNFHHMAAVLEETTNKVYIVDLGSTTSTASFLSTTVGVQLNNTTAVQFGTNNIPQQGNATTTNADNDVWTFTPQSTACTQAPISVVASNSPTSICPGGTTLLTGAVTPSETGQVYQWESSTDDINYNPIVGSTSTSYTATITSSLYYRMSAACGAGTPTISTGILITPLSTTLPYSQTFTSGTPPNDCWIAAKGLVNNPTNLTYTGTTWTADGWLNSGIAGAARLNIVGTGLNQWLLSPSFTLSGAAKQVEFDIALTNAGLATAGALGVDDTILVIISTDNGVTWSKSNTLSSWNSGSAPISSTGSRVILDLTAYSGMSVKIGFYGESSVANSSTDLFIDNFVIQDIPLCTAPTLLIASAGTNSDKATLSWTNPVVAPNSYDWIIVLTGAGTGATPVDMGNTTHPNNLINTNSVLMPSTTYDAYVRAACSSANSPWVGPVTFKTECLGSTGFSQNFDPPNAISGTGGTIPACWNRILGGGSSYVQGSNAAPWSGTQRYIFIANTGQTPMAISPVISNLNDPTYRLRFRTAVSSAGAGKTIQVGYMTNPNDANSFVLVSTVTVNNTAPDATWTTVTMPANAPAVGYLVWRHPGTASYNLYFDDVSWETIPACGEVSNLTTANVGTNAFDFSWTAPTSGTPLAYNYEIRTYGAGGSGTTGLETSGIETTTTKNLTGITAGRRYAVYVQTDCGSGTTSTWFGPINVTTTSINDECANAVTLGVNPDLSYTNFTVASTAGATLSAGNACNPAASTNPNNDDVWFSFTATDVAHEIKFFSPQLGSPYSLDMVTAVYSGTCASLVQIDCEDPETFALAGLSPGQTYYLRTFTKSATTTTIATQNLGVGTPPAMTYNSTVATNNIQTDASAGTSNAQILKIEVNVSGANAPLSVAKFDFNTNGSTNNADISAAKLYFTGTDNAFSSAVQFGTTVSNPGNNFTFSGAQQLTGAATTATNYFWLVYDVACTSTVGNILDAELDSLFVGNISNVVSLAPFGSRFISGNTSYDTKANGNWNDFNTWSCGIPPTGTTAQINISHDVTVDTNVDVNANINIASAKKLTINSNSFKTGPTGGGNKTLSINGILEIQSNTLTVNGNVNFATGSTLAMSGGNMTIDPNDGTSVGSGPAGTTSLNIATNNFNMTDGKITIVDPNYNATGSALVYSGTAHRNLTGGTIALGDGISTTDGGAVGFNVTTYTASTARLAFYNFEVNSLTGVNRFATNTTGMAILNDFNILSGEFRSTSGFNVAGNWLNNGKFTSNNTVYLTIYASATSTATAKPQLISGTGIFDGLAALPSNFFSLNINNINPAGVTFANDMTVSGTLTLAQGPVTIGTMTVGTSVAVPGSISSSGTGRINGNLKKWFTTNTGTTALKIGTLTADRTASVNFSSALLSGGTLNAKFSSGAPTIPGLPMTQGTLSIDDVSPTGYWTVTADNGLAFGAASAYTMTVNATGFTETNGTTLLSSLPNLRLIKRADAVSNWDPIGSVSNPGSASAPSGTTLGNISASGLKSFSEFAVGGNQIGIGVSLILNAKVFLQYVDPTTRLMNDYMKTIANFPLSDPYSLVPYNTVYVHVNSGPVATTTPAVLAVSGDNSIVDWVFLELRSGTPGATTVVQTRAALLQKDGDIVSTNGVSPVSFTGLPASYYVAVRHRNHLGFRTENLIPLSNSVTNLNFTDNSVPLYGTFPTNTYAASPPYATMISGDANEDGSVDSIDSIIWETNNGLFDDYHFTSDYNLDGSVDSVDSIFWEFNNGKYEDLN
ncbi:MAG: fibronectin type III domain-containing protein [Saprospiraceae bacterium]